MPDRFDYKLVSVALINLMLGMAATAIFSAFQVRAITSDLRAMVTQVAQVANDVSGNRIVNDRQDRDIQRLEDSLITLTDSLNRYILAQRGGG